MFTADFKVGFVFAVVLYDKLWFIEVLEICRMLSRLPQIEGAVDFARKIH